MLKSIHPWLFRRKAKTQLWQLQQLPKTKFLEKINRHCEFPPQRLCTKQSRPLAKGALMTLNIVMVEPQIPQNTGNVARTCAATGARLHLVGPMAFKVDDKKLKRAGLDYWHLLDISYYKDIEEFFDVVTGGIIKAIPIDQETARKSTSDSTITFDTSSQAFHYFTTKAPQIYTEPDYKDNAYLFFGSETKGLDEALLYQNPDQCVRLPMLPGARSMNLSNAVAIGVFEVLRQWNFPKLQNYGKMSDKL